VRRFPLRVDARGPEAFYTAEDRAWPPRFIACVRVDTRHNASFAGAVTVQPCSPAAKLKLEERDRACAEFAGFRALWSAATLKASKDPRENDAADIETHGLSHPKVYGCASVRPRLAPTMNPPRAREYSCAVSPSNKSGDDFAPCLARERCRATAPSCHSRAAAERARSRRAA
jgi:hypothetical protein